MIPPNSNFMASWSLIVLVLATASVAPCVHAPDPRYTWTGPFAGGNITAQYLLAPLEYRERFTEAVADYECFLRLNKYTPSEYRERFHDAAAKCFLRVNKHSPEYRERFHDAAADYECFVRLNRYNKYTPAPVCPVAPEPAPLYPVPPAPVCPVAPASTEESSCEEVKCHWKKQWIICLGFLFNTIGLLEYVIPCYVFYKMSVHDWGIQQHDAFTEFNILIEIICCLLILALHMAFISNPNMSAIFTAFAGICFGTQQLYHIVEKKTEANEQYTKAWHVKAAKRGLFIFFWIFLFIMLAFYYQLQHHQYLPPDNRASYVLPTIAAILAGFFKFAHIVVPFVSRCKTNSWHEDSNAAKGGKILSALALTVSSFYESAMYYFKEEYLHKSVAHKAVLFLALWYAFCGAILLFIRLFVTPKHGQKLKRKWDRLRKKDLLGDDAAALQLQRLPSIRTGDRQFIDKIEALKKDQQVQEQNLKKKYEDKHMKEQAQLRNKLEEEHRKQQEQLQKKLHMEHVKNQQQHLETELQKQHLKHQQQLRNELKEHQQEFEKERREQQMKHKKELTSERLQHMEQTQQLENELREKHKKQLEKERCAQEKAFDDAQSEVKHLKDALQRRTDELVQLQEKSRKCPG